MERNNSKLEIYGVVYYNQSSAPTTASKVALSCRENMVRDAGNLSFISKSEGNAQDETIDNQLCGCHI